MIGGRLDTDDRAPDSLASATMDPTEIKDVQSDMREAYARGRADERASRRRHPIFMTVTFAAALCGLALLALAVANGSFSRGGDVADQNLQAAVNQAEPQVRAAASQAGQSLQNAGQAAKAKVSGSAN